MALLSTYPGILPEKKHRPLEIDLDMKGSIIYHTECLSSLLKAITYSTKLKHTIAAIKFYIERTKQYFQVLVAECHRQAHPISTLRNKLFQELGHYRLEDIYRKQYQQILKHSDSRVRTRAMYLNAFMKIRKHFNYKHPAFISDKDIRGKSTLHRMKSAAHHNIPLSGYTANNNQTYQKRNNHIKSTTYIPKPAHNIKVINAYSLWLQVYNKTHRYE
jgi:hypothetical protein